MNHSNDLWKIHRYEKKKYVEKYFARDNTAALALSSKANKHCLCSTCHFSWFCITFRIATQGFLWGTEPFKSLGTSLPDSCLLLHNTVVFWLCMLKVGICSFLRGQLEKDTEGRESLQKVA